MTPQQEIQKLKILPWLPQNTQLKVLTSTFGEMTFTLGEITFSFGEILEDFSFFFFSFFVLRGGGGLGLSVGRGVSWGFSKRGKV